MAQTIVTATALRIAYDYGVDENEKPIIKTASYTKINPAATAEALYTAAEQLGKLAANDSQMVNKVTTKMISN